MQGVVPDDLPLDTFAEYKNLVLCDKLGWTEENLANTTVKFRDLMRDFLQEKDNQEVLAQNRQDNVQKEADVLSKLRQNNV